jgi:hypothetical protein
MEAEKYRLRAKRCLTQVKLISDDREKAKVIDLASKWLLLAQRAEWSKPSSYARANRKPAI